MPRSLHAWYSLNELDTLSQRAARLDGEIDAARLKRLREWLHSDDGRVRAGLRFGRQGGGYITVELSYETDLELACQRCLEPMRETASGRVSLVVLEDESMAAGAPAGYEPIMLYGGRLQPATVIEDELIVSLPLVPRHPRIQQCGGLARSLEPFMADNDRRPSDPSTTSH